MAISPESVAAKLEQDLNWALSLPNRSEPEEVVPLPGNEALASAFLRQLHADATRNKPSRPGGWPLTLRMRRDALRFLFSSSEALQELRLWWCAQAGIHPDKMRRIVERDIRLLLAGSLRVSRTGAVRSSHA